MDPEIPLSIFKIDKQNKRPTQPVGMPPTFSPFDLNALEAALRLKDQNPGDCEITILSLGKNLPKALIQKVLAMGADEAVTLDDTSFEHLDPYSTVQSLAAGIRKIGEFDLVFTGRQAADWDAGVVWAGIAQELDLPSVTIARKIELDGQKAVIERCVSDGIEVLETDLPALITFSSEVGEPRFASLKAIIQAKKKNIVNWTALDIDFKIVNGITLKDLTEPKIIDTDCQFIDGRSDEEKGRQLARMIQTPGSLFQSSKDEVSNG